MYQGETSTVWFRGKALVLREGSPLENRTVCVTQECFLAHPCLRFRGTVMQQSSPLKDIIMHHSFDSILSMK